MIYRLSIQPEQEAWLQETQKRFTELGYKDREPWPRVHDESGLHVQLCHPGTEAIVSVCVHRAGRTVSSHWTVDTYDRFFYDTSVSVRRNGKVDVHIRDMRELPRLLMLMQIMGVSRVDKLSEGIFIAAVGTFEEKVRQLVWPWKTGLETLKEENAVRRAVQRAGLRSLEQVLTWASEQPHETCACGATASAALFRRCVACGETRCLSCGEGEMVRQAHEEFARPGWACHSCMSSGKVVYPRFVK